MVIFRERTIFVIHEWNRKLLYYYGNMKMGLTLPLLTLSYSSENFVFVYVLHSVSSYVYYL